MAEGEAPDILKWLRDWLWRRWGWRGAFAFALSGVTLFVWTNTDKIASWPGISWLVEHMSRDGVPRADPKRFTILVAKFDNDVKDEQRKVLLHGLLEFKGVEVLPLDRTIAADGPISEEAERAGHERAREFLKESGGSVVLWGTVLRVDGKAVPRVWWTPDEDGPRDGRYVTDSALRLPELFWTDLSSILDLLISRHDAESAANEGHFVADRLVTTVARVRTLLNATKGRSGWTPEQIARTRLVLAGSLTTLSEQTGQTKPLNEAVVAYRAALEEYTRERAPLDWAMTQNYLGIALCSLGEREGGTARLEEAVAAHRAALEEWTRARAPLEWAMTQNGL
ncbi:MAG: hypothetical protein HQL38_01985, partial [Alphaproteobacteria bacterium]|nr:hypothetical protein [Alphaproteobacteria bacterium]